VQTNITELNPNGFSLPELTPEAHVKILRTTINEKDVVIYASTTQSRQIGLYFYDATSGAFMSSRYLGFSNPYEVASLTPTKDGGLAVCGTTYVAGRFSNILHYDRRKFPAIQGSIHSGARLCGLSSLPYPFSCGDSERRRKGQLSLDQLQASKSAQGRTLVACGEYNTKGSLELYSIGPGGAQVGADPDDLVLRNRQTSSRSKLLSVASHGTRLVLSDGSGQLKWLERDGFTEVRSCRIGHCESVVSGDGGEGHTASLFISMPGSDELARKLLPTRRGPGGGVGGVNNDDVLFWTGERLGLVRFSPKAGFTADEFEDEARTAEELEREKAERAYSERVRMALQRQAEDVRFVQGLGLGADV
jgi:hypothetical protein